MTICASGLKAQTDTAYHLHFFLPDSAKFITCLGWVYNIAGDTLIDGKKMKKVYESAIEPDNYYAAIHEDTLNAKYYAVYKDETVEKLFMDFSSKVVENIMVSDKYITQNVRVDSIHFNKNGRKVVFLRSECGDFDCWIEGVGSTRYMLFPPKYCIADISAPPLKKIVVGDSIVYEQYTTADCESFSYTSVAAVIKNSDISIYPNPAKDYLLIDTEIYECHTYDIISTSGRILQRGELQPSIDISSLPQGAKLIVVKNDNGEIVYSNKFIKE